MDRTHRFCSLAAFVLSLLAVLLSGCSGVHSAQTPATAPQVTLQSSAATINSGQAATLTWTSSNATAVSISPSVGSGTLPLSGSASVAPTTTTTYTITATGSGGTTATATATVTVNGAPSAAPTVTLSVNPSSINSGEQAALSWTSTNATSVTITPDVLTDELNSLPVAQGSASIQPAQTTTYTITATGPGGTATATATINVTQVPPTINLTLTPTTIVSGKSSTLSWSTNNAKTLTITGSDGSTVPVTNPQQGTGTAVVKPTTTTTYTATATSPAGISATATAVLTVSALNVTLTANPTSIQPGGSSTLTYTSANATSLSIDNGIGAVVPPSGTTAPVSPRVTTIYTITATDASGLTTTATATVSVDNGLQSIQHILFFVQENRSFDNYFSKLGVYKASKGLPNDVDGIPDDSQFSNSDPTGAAVHPFHLQTVCVDNTSPSWDESHVDVNNGKMDGFVKVASHTGGKNDPNGHRAMGYYDQTDLPYYYELATQYATSDRWFAPELANTIPNRMYLFTATSYGTTYPEVPATDASGNSDYNQPTIFEALTNAGVSWRYYFQDNSTFLSQYPSAWNNLVIRGNVRPISEYFAILSGQVPVAPSGDTTLPQVVFLERGSGSADTDEHPDAEYDKQTGLPIGKSNQKGAAAAANIINAWLTSPYYADSAFFLTYDEPGGLFDHVAPATATPPDTQPASTVPPPPGNAGVIPGDFASTGMRIPFILISPYVNPHFVSHTPRDNTAILKFIEDRFIPGSHLTARDAAQPDMLEFFNFSQPALLTPPLLPVQPTTGTCNPALESQ